MILQCYVCVPRGGSRGCGCPLMRTCVVFHISHPAPMGSGLVQRRALAFQIRCTIPFDNDEGGVKYVLLCWVRTVGSGVGYQQPVLNWSQNF